MCGRFALFALPAAVAEYFDCELTAEAAAAPPRYNVAPGQPIAVVRTVQGARRLEPLLWGLVPHWARDLAIGRRLINARGESLATTPSFRDAYRQRRCLIPASGFYEWGAVESGRKRPFFARGTHEPLLALAGLWDGWRRPDGTWLRTTVIVTTAANDVLAPVHERMPLVLGRADQARWLAAGVTPLAELASRSPELAVHAVGFDVNDPRRDDAALVAPVA